MDYEKLIETVSSILNNDGIVKEGLSLVYKLDEKAHTKMNQTLYYKSNPDKADFEDTNEFEVEVGGILVKFIKK